MGHRLTVDPRTLTPLVLVRIQVPQPNHVNDLAENNRNIAQTLREFVPASCTTPSSGVHLSCPATLSAALMRQPGSTADRGLTTDQRAGCHALSSSSANWGYCVLAGANSQAMSDRSRDETVACVAMDFIGS